MYETRQLLFETESLKISGKVKLADYVRTYTVLAQSPEILNS